MHAMALKAGRRSVRWTIEGLYCLYVPEELVQALCGANAKCCKSGRRGAILYDDPCAEAESKGASKWKIYGMRRSVSAREHGQKHVQRV